MKVQIERDGEFIELDKVLIQIGDVDFRISQNKFGELVINKYNNGEGSGAISIEPKVSNEIIVK